MQEISCFLLLHTLCFDVDLILIDVSDNVKFSGNQKKYSEKIHFSLQPINQSKTFDPVVKIYRLSDEYDLKTRY